MRFCLALAFQNEAPWLRLHLPVLLQSLAIDGVVALDGGSQDDSASYLRSLGANVFERPFDWQFAAHMNALIAHCEALDYDAVLRIDPDELLFPQAIDAIRVLLTRFRVLRLARFNFEADRLHYFPYMYPDYQTRAWLLNNGVRYSGTVHETLEASFAQLGWHEDGGTGQGPRDIVMCPHLHLYHYEGIRRDAVRRLKHINYHRIMGGEAPLSELPVGLGEDRPRFNIPFVGPQPLDPREIGLRAPFVEAAAV